MWYMLQAIKAVWMIVHYAWSIVRYCGDQVCVHYRELRGCPLLRGGGVECIEVYVDFYLCSGIFY